MQSVPGKPFVRILLGKQSGKGSERQSHTRIITPDSQLTYHSLKRLTCSNIKPQEHPIMPRTEPTPSGRGGSKCSCASPLAQPGTEGSTTVFHSVGAIQLRPNFHRVKKKKENVSIFPLLSRYCSLFSHQQRDVVRMDAGWYF